MTRYECAGCESLSQFPGREADAFVARCPVCETETRWTVAFEAEGVSF